jgi:hypothetical protein
VDEKRQREISVVLRLNVNLVSAQKRRLCVCSHVKDGLLLPKWP